MNNFIKLVWYLIKIRLSFPVGLFWTIVFPTIMFVIGRNLTYWATFIIFANIFFTFLSSLQSSKEDGLLKSTCSTRRTLWRYILALFLNIAFMTTLSFVILFSIAVLFFELSLTFTMFLKLLLAFYIIFTLYSAIFSVLLAISTWVRFETHFIIMFVFVVYTLSAGLDNTLIFNIIEPVNLFYLCMKVFNNILFGYVFKNSDIVTMALLPFVAVFSIFLFIKKFTVISKLSRS